MPPSPTVKATLNEVKWSQLLKAMNFNDAGPRVLFTTSHRATGSKVIVHATYYPAADKITVHVNLSQFENDKLRYVATSITESLLHEVRHAWQLRAWGHERYFADNLKEYSDRDKEKDANHFANTHVHEWYGLVQIRRSVPRGGFTQLGRHATGRIV